MLIVVSDSGHLGSPLGGKSKESGNLSPIPGPSGLQTPCDSVMSRQSKASSSNEDSDSGESISSPPVSTESLHDMENGGDYGDFNYTCSICNEIFPTGQQLIEHEQVTED